MSLGDLQNRRRARWLGAGLLWRVGEGEGELEGKLPRLHIAFPEMEVILAPDPHNSGRQADINIFT